MRTFALALGLALGVAWAAPLPAHGVCDSPHCIDVVVPVPRGLIVPDSTVRILLPADYDTTRRRYPVLYLLHGAGDTFATWTEQTDVQDFSAQFPLVIVMPDGGHDASAGRKQERIGLNMRLIWRPLCLTAPGHTRARLPAGRQQRSRWVA